MWSLPAIILVFIVLIMVLFMSWVWWVSNHLYVIDPAVGGYSSHPPKQPNAKSIALFGKCQGNACKTNLHKLLNKPAEVHTQQFGTLTGKVKAAGPYSMGLPEKFVLIDVVLDTQSAKVVGTHMYKFSTKDTISVYV
jgi:hypothetical protein